MSNGIESAGFYERSLGPKKVHEATMSRLLHHIAADDKGFIMLSAYKGYRTSTENYRLNHLLVRHLGHPNAGSTLVASGGYPETDAATGKVTPVSTEYSWFITGVSKADAIGIAKEVGRNDPRHGGYDQDSILWGSKQDGVWEISRDGTPTYKGDAVKIGDLAHIWSQIRGKKFTFGKDGTPPQLPA